MPHRWFDGHLDLAYLAECGRDMHAEPEYSPGRYRPAAITFPSLREGAVAACLGTIFTEALLDTNDKAAQPNESGPFAYPAEDAEAAQRAGLRQLRLYQMWAQAGVIDLMPRHTRLQECAASPDRILVGLLMESADPIRDPDQLEWWADNGVVAIGLTWSRGSRYAAGNDPASCTRDPGLTTEGQRLVERMDELGIVHDLSHLSQRATDELLALTTGAVMASHSNCRALLDHKNERHITDETIREVGRRGGIVGANLVSAFISKDLRPGERATTQRWADHVERITSLMGHRQGVALGSDMDGGFPSTKLPSGIDKPKDLERLAETLRKRGWSDTEIQALAWNNWARFWNITG